MVICHLRQILPGTAHSADRIGSCPTAPCAEANRLWRCAALALVGEAVLHHQFGITWRWNGKDDVLAILQNLLIDFLQGCVLRRCREQRLSAESWQLSIMREHSRKRFKKPLRKTKRYA